MRRLILCLAILSALSACGADSKWASDEAVEAARYVDDGPPSITLFTVVNKRSGSGGHSSIMINASQRVIFDPAGTWYHPKLPERHDVHFGITPKMEAFYVDYHARETYNVVQQTVEVSPQVAEIALQRVLANGAVNKAFCANSVAVVLRGVPGFESIPATLFPNSIMKAFGALPGATTRVITDDDDDENHGVLMVQVGDPRVQ